MALSAALRPILVGLEGLCFWDSGRFAEILRFRGKIAYAGS